MAKRQDKSCLAKPSDLHGLLPSSSDPKQSTDAHTPTYTASLSLLPCIAPLAVLIPQEDIPYSWACRKEVDKGRKRRLLPGCGWGQRGSARCFSSFSTMTVLLCPPHLGVDCWSHTNIGNYMGYVILCVSEGQIAMVLAYPYIIYTATGRFLLSNQDSG